MLTEDQLADQLRAQLRRELSAVEPGPDLLPGVRRRQARRSLATRASLVAVPGAAFAVAAALIVPSIGGGAAAAPASGPAKPAVLTAATVKQVASQSRRALARSGQARISYRTSYDGTFTGSGSDRIKFAGHNWNDVITQNFPASNGVPASTQTAINRIVNGQLYLHIVGPDNRVRWYHDTNPAGHPSISVPDPRTLLGLLNPTAKFQVIGHRQVGGTRLTGLRATASPVLRPLSWLPGAEPGAHVASLTVWVDAHHVMHQMSLRITKNVDPIYLEKSVKNGSERIKIIIPSRAYLKEAQAMARKMRHLHATVSIDPSRSAQHHLQGSDISVTFGGFGQAQVIPVPPNAVPEFSQG
ncbi:MAG TPA: hypothetical protein VK599_00305 [Streptosporangiaceae bacterium]|nr:hypothetical protein [Streptosporangiaceae bacterium]